jgi:ribosomal protein L21E
MWKTVRISEDADCHPFWHGKIGIVVDTEADAYFEGVLWNVKMQTHDAPVTFAEHELEEMK